MAEGFFWGNDPNVNQQLRQRIALAMLANKRKHPTNVGEGLSAIGDAIGDRGLMKQMMDADLASQASGNAALGRIEGGGGPMAYAPTEDVPTDSVAPAASAAPSEPPVPLFTAPEQPASMLRPELPTGLGGASEGGIGPESMYTSPKPLGMPAPAAAPVQGAQGDRWPQQSAALAGIESGGQKNPYATVGAVTKSGDRAYGKYQIMGANIPEWTKAALGRPLTVEQFLADPDAQEATARHRFQQYASKYGDEGAARAWFAGEQGMKNLSATDVHGRLNVGSYGQDFMRRMGGPQASAAPRDAVAAQLVAQGQDPVEPPPGQQATLGSPILPQGLSAAPPQQAIRAMPAPQPPVRLAQAGPQQAPPAGYVLQLPPEAQMPEKTPQTPREQRALRELQLAPNNEYVKQNATRVLAEEASKKQYQDARNLEVYKDKLTQRHELLKLQEQQRADAPKRITDEEKNRAEAVMKATEARIVQRTGMPPKEFYERMDLDKKNVDQTIKAQSAQQLARKAINDGVITGYGANMRINSAKFADWAFKNKMSGDLAANTEIMSAALKAGLSEAVKTVNGEGGTGVSNTDVRIAEGISGSDPVLQMKTIKSIMDRAAEINHRKINGYEEQVDRYLGGEPSELRYRSSHGPTAPGEHIQMLMNAQRDPAQAAKTKAFFDEAYGPGAADLELARVARLARKRGRGG